MYIYALRIENANVNAESNIKQKQAINISRIRHVVYPTNTERKQRKSIYKSILTANYVYLYIAYIIPEQQGY